ncbi:PAS domain-containing protein [Thermostaphylospora chromogena]|uniref:Aerotaxis receptor n=1 Tax=Thermostaphylospora chromogena TaxID=35622 RepID=A0A1H1DZP5_9ACTN|nr:PAS domain-containing protein [Thermostaphylospora chromogena]SDQ81729.1 aerotaxis receptor [Thermostaphylospora chromogena]
MSSSGVIAPSGVEQVIGPEELFFSTTDRRGVIRSGNSVFVRVSGFSLAELTGSPHNIVRHPDMPAGVFRLIWSRLLAGRPAGAYVRNLTKDGGHYWVFATITPSGDGFLSVRMAPRARLFETVKRVYADVLEAERDAARREGTNRREVASAGLERLERNLGELGFGSYDDFLTEALTTEVAARGQSAFTRYARPGATGPIGEVLAGAEKLKAALADLVQQLEGHRRFGDRLMHAATQVLVVARRLDHTVAAARTASATVAQSVPVLHNVARAMADPTRTAVTALERLEPRLAALRSDVMDLRFRIALASVHTDMVAAFAAEVVDGHAPHTSLEEVPLLCDVMRESTLEMSARAQQVHRALREVASEVAAAGEGLEEFRRFLGQWRLLVLRHGAEDALSAHLASIDDYSAASWDGIAMLNALAGEFGASAMPFDFAALEDQVAAIRAKAVIPD